MGTTSKTNTGIREELAFVKHIDTARIWLQNALSSKWRNTDVLVDSSPEAVTAALVNYVAGGLRAKTKEQTRWLKEMPVPREQS